MKKLNLVPGSIKKLMKNPKFRSVWLKFSGKHKRQMNRLKKKFIMKKYWK